MQENNMRLIDEAVSSEAVKNTFRLGWEFITLNKKFTISAIVVLFVLSLLGTLPLVGFVFSLFSSVFALAVQIYIGRLVYETDNIETFVDEINSIDGQKLIERYFAPALGAYMGWMAMALLFIGAISLYISSSGVDINSNNELFSLLSSVGIPLMFIMLLFAYVQPLVQSNVVMANDFKEGFLGVLSIFSTNIWSLALRGSYFKYVSVYGIFAILLTILFSSIFSIFSVIPIVNLFILIIFVYIFSVVMTVSAVIARRVAE